MRIWFYFTLFVLAHAVFAEDSFSILWKDYLENHLPLSEVSEVYGEAFSEDLETEIRSEREFLLSRCESSSLRSIANMMYHLSHVESMILLKECRISPKKKWPQLETAAKQKLFEITKFPKLEIIGSLKDTADAKEILEKLYSAWEERVYRFSNFYQTGQISYLSKEKAITQTINELVYVDMNPERKLSLLRKMVKDLREEEESLFQTFLYSHQNLFSVQKRSLENQRNKETLETLLAYFLSHPALQEPLKTEIKEWKDCLNEIKLDAPGIRLSVFSGFLQDYQRFPYLASEAKPKELFQVSQFLHKNLFSSHHFTRRIQESLQTCRKLASYGSKERGDQRTHR
ncbi:hypothetical protein LPTSP4_02260 [Leptospira ryugenii]|uniref:Uncharacterized protein n=1 Tax=Leptospira ryugenii TaxID=1917863 RepID=A0A2P2DVR9_9LEPT|nr:hypothetical protein [Leptospira ryugenii]GBF48726.1 hypothetical protein LPTSP4_02260 [Leptospira ryugenii]